jgi:PKD repeat protein
LTTNGSAGILTIGTTPNPSLGYAVDISSNGIVKLNVTGGSPGAPVAAFSGSPTSGVAGLVVTFLDSSTGTITNHFWSFGDGATTNTTAGSLTHTYNNVGSYDVSLTVTGPAGTKTLTYTGYITITPAPPMITTGVTAANAALQVGNLILVVAGDTNLFSVGATDSGGGTLGYQWSFGDGVTNAWSATNTVAHAYTTNCGPYTASVTISNGSASVTSNFTVAVACQLHLFKLAPKLNFTKTNADSCTVVGAFEPPAGVNFAGKLATLNIGGAQLSFTLPARGRALNGLSSFTTPSLNKRTGLWSLKATFKNGSWQAPWANYSMIDSNIPKPGLLVNDLPVILVLDTEAFMATTNLHYSAIQGKSGTAK